MRDETQNATHDAVMSEANFLAALNPPTQERNKLHEIVELLIDLMWRESDWRKGEWDALTPEQQQKCGADLAVDIEFGFGRLGNPWKGCSPLEYLAMKAAEQKTMAECAEETVSNR